MAWTVLFYREGGEVPALDWLLGESEEAQEKCRLALTQLAAQGHQARRPLVENLGGGLYELRVRLGRINYRLLYFFYGQTAVVISHGFTKERELPTVDLDRALRRKAAFERAPEAHAMEVEL